MNESELKSTIAVELDGTKVETGVSAVKKSLAGMGDAAKAAGTAMHGVGTATDESLKGTSKTVEATQRTINAFVSQIKNSVTDIKAAGDAAEKYRLRAIDKGIPENVYAPYIAQLKAAEQAQASLASAAVSTNGKIAMSAAAMSNAMRGVPAQFTDIVVSLQSGQAPLTVLMQQGGQLKDMFGGVGNAVKAMGTYVLGLINPVTVLAAGVGAFGYAAYRASEDAKALQNALILTGTQGVTSLSSLDGVAKGLSDVGVRSGVARDALVDFITAGVRVDGNLQAITKAAIDLEKYGGAAVQETAKAFAELAKDPLAALDKLTLATYQQVEALLKQGDRTGAVVAAQKAFTESTENTARALSSQQGPLDVATEAWKRYGAAVWDSVKGVAASIVGAPKTGDATRKELQMRRDRYAAEGYDTTKEDAELARYKRLDEAQKQGIANLQKEGELKNLLAKFDEKDAGTKKLRERALLLADNNRLLAAGLITQKQFDESVKAFDKAPKPKTSALSEADKGLREYNDLIAKSVGLNANFSEEWDKLSAAYKAGKISVSGLTMAQAELLKEQKFSKDIVKGLAAETDAYAKAESATTAAHLAAINAQDKRTKHLQEQLAKQLEHNAAIGLSADAVGELEMATHLLTAAELERKANLQDGVMWSADVIAGYREQAKLEREIAEAKRAGGAKTAADEAEKEWKKAAAKINDSITDALMRGFESGKSFAENLRDTVTNMFKTMVLRPTVSAIVNPVAQGITGALGLSGAANAAGAAGAASSVGTLAAGVSAFGGTLATGFVNTLVGSGMSGGLTAAGAMIANGAWASGLGMAAGALGPIGLGIAALSMIGNKDKSSSNTGDSSATYGSSGALLALQTTNGLNKTTTDMAAALQASYMAAAKSLGIALAQTNYNVNTNNGREGENPNTIIDSTVNGSRYTSGEVGSSDSAAMQLAASRAVFNALQSSDLPQYLSKVFDGLSAGALSQDQITNTLAYAQSLKQVRDGLLETREPLQILKDNVAKGVAALATSTETFKTDFVAAIDGGISPEKLAQWQDLQSTMSDLEAASKKAADAVKDVGRTLEDIANERKGLQDQLDALTMSSTDLLAKQREAIDASNRALFDQVQAAQTARNILEERSSLEEQLLQLQGNTTALRQRELEAIAPSNRALQESIYALQDVKTAQEAYNTALSNAEGKLSSASSALESARNAVEAIRNTGTDRYLSALDKVSQAQDSIANAADSAAQKMAQLGKSLRDFIAREVISSAAGAPSIAVANQAFARTLAQARGGNDEAIADLENKGRTALDSARAGSSTSAQYQAIRNTVLQGIASVASTLPAVTEQDKSVELQRNLLSAQNDLVEALRVANAIGAPLQRAQDELINRFSTAQIALARAQADYAAASAVLEAIKANTAQTAANVLALNGNLVVQLQADAQSEITKLITVIGDASTLTPEIRDLVLMESNSISKNIDLIANSAMTPELKTLALMETTNIVKALSLIANSSLTPELKTLALMDNGSISKYIALIANSSLTEDMKTLALMGTASVSKYISLVSSSSLNPDDKALALMASNSIVKIIGAALGSADPTAIQIALAQSSLLTRTIAAVGGSLTDDQRTVLNALTGASSVSVVVSGNTTSTVSFDPNDPIRSVWQSIKDLNTQSVSNTYSMHSALAWIASMLSNMLNHINTVHVVFDRAGGGGPVYAKGGVFSNRVIDSPTAFDESLMGEAGPEAIMPLKRGSDGSLGVVASIDYKQFGRGNDALVAEIRTLREENRAQASAIVGLNQRMTKLFERWDGNGLPSTRTEA